MIKYGKSDYKFIFSCLFFQRDGVHLSIIVRIFLQDFDSSIIPFSTNDISTFKMCCLEGYYHNRLSFCQFSHLSYAFLSFCYTAQIKIQMYLFYSLLNENPHEDTIITVITFSSIAVF